MEILDVYDDSGHKTGKTIVRGEKVIEGEYTYAVAVWVINSDNKLLIQRRAVAKVHKPNFWAVTGGVVDSGEDGVTACIREAKEEIGLDIDFHELRLLRRKWRDDIFFDVFIVQCDMAANQFILQDTEVSEVRWFTIEEITELNKRDEFMFDCSEELALIEEHIYQF